MKIVESASLSFLSAEEPEISSGPDQPQKNSQTSIQALDKKLEANKRAVSPAAVAHRRLDHDLIVLVKTTRLCRRELSPTNPRPRVPRVPLNQLPWPVSSSKKTRRLAGMWHDLQGPRSLEGFLFASELCAGEAGGVGPVCARIISSTPAKDH
jgi:hypothetical protein